MTNTRHRFSKHHKKCLTFIESLKWNSFPNSYKEEKEMAWTEFYVDERPMQVCVGTDENNACEQCYLVKHDRIKKMVVIECCKRFFDLDEKYILGYYDYGFDYVL